MLISFTNSDGDTFPIQGNYILSPKWDGFGELPIEHQSTKAPYQDGETYIDSVVNTRVLSIEFTILGNNQQEVFNRRRTVARHFNPKLGPGTLKWKQDNEVYEYWLDCIPSSLVFPSEEGRGRTFQTVILQFHVFKPFWYNPTQIERYLVGFDGGLSFPFSFPINFGTVGTTIIVTNNGNVNTPVLLHFAGEVTDPVIENETTGESITISKVIADGDTLIINTAFGEKSVQILSGETYTNAFEYVDPDSTFWQLIPGDNTVKYTATSEGENAQCRLFYYNRYSGV